MNAILIVLSIIAALVVMILAPIDGVSAVLLCAIAAVVTLAYLFRIKEDREFLMQIFAAGLLVRVAIALMTYVFELQEFFCADAAGYDELGFAVMKLWQGETYYKAAVEWLERTDGAGGWGMLYYVAGIYTLVGRNTLAVQMVTCVFGAATAPIIYLCTRHIYQNKRAARLAALIVALFPSLVLWSSQGIKDGLIIFLLAIVIWATLQLSDKLSFKFFAVLVAGLLGILTLRFYVFYMIVAAIGGTFLIGTKNLTTERLVRQIVLIVCIGLALTYFGVLQTASVQFSRFANLETAQRSRTYLASAGQSGFGADVDISTTSGAISMIPIGLTYLLFAPFPWDVANLRQSITLPEMIVWWLMFPIVLLGAWFTIKYRLRQALPILLFTAMLTLAYSIFQGNVGTAYRQRAQLLVFYFVFAAVGFVLLKERRENKKLSEMQRR